MLDKLQLKYFTQTVMFIFFSYRKEGDNEFMNIIANEINTEVRLLTDGVTLIISLAYVFLKHSF